MFYVYVLYSREQDEFYLGSTTDLKKRLASHRQGENKSTQKAQDWIVSYYEAYLTEYASKQREANLKRSGKAYHSLKLRIRTTLDNLGEGEALDRSPSKRRP
jgi:putative endonuclease